MYRSRPETKFSSYEEDDELDTIRETFVFYFFKTLIFNKFILSKVINFIKKNSWHSVNFKFFSIKIKVLKNNNEKFNFFFQAIFKFWVILNFYLLVLNLITFFRCSKYNSCTFFDKFLKCFAFRSYFFQITVVIMFYIILRTYYGFFLLILYNFSNYVNNK